MKTLTPAEPPCSAGRPLAIGIDQKLREAFTEEELPTALDDGARRLSNYFLGAESGALGNAVGAAAFRAVHRLVHRGRAADCAGRGRRSRLVNGDLDRRAVHRIELLASRASCCGAIAPSEFSDVGSQSSFAASSDTSSLIVFFTRSSCSGWQNAAPRIFRGELHASERDLVVVG